jgi:hypothetical protein
MTTKTPDEKEDWKVRLILDATPYCLSCEVEGHRTHECHSTSGFNSPRDMEMARLAWIAGGNIAAPPAARGAPVISVEDSLRTRLRWSQEKVEQLEEENRTLRGRLPGPSFDDLMAAKRPTLPPSPQSEH